MSVDKNNFDFYRDRISDAWADIRACSSNLWQIVALTVAASAIIVNIIGRPGEGGSLIILDLAGWAGIGILVGFRFFSTMMVRWISGAIAERVHMVEGLARKIGITETPFAAQGYIKKRGHKLEVTATPISKVVSWVPVRQLTAFFRLMWLVFVCCWYFQLLLLSYDSTVMIYLLIFQTVVSEAMAPFLLRRIPA